MLRKHEGKQVFSEKKKSDLRLLSIQANAFNRWNNKKCSLLFLRYHTDNYGFFIRSFLACVKGNWSHDLFKAFAHILITVVMTIFF